MADEKLSSACCAPVHVHVVYSTTQGYKIEKSPRTHFTIPLCRCASALHSLFQLREYEGVAAVDGETARARLPANLVMKWWRPPAQALSR